MSVGECVSSGTPERKETMPIHLQQTTDVSLELLRSPLPQAKRIKRLSVKVEHLLQNKNGRRRTIAKLAFVGLLSVIVAMSSAHAQSASPDGSILIENLTTADGTWTFGPPSLPNNWSIYLNGQPTPHKGSEMVVANGGQLYVLSTDNDLWLGQGCGCGPVAPQPLS